MRRQEGGQEGGGPTSVRMHGECTRKEGRKERREGGQVPILAQTKKKEEKRSRHIIFPSDTKGARRSGFARRFKTHSPCQLQRVHHLRSQEARSYLLGRKGLLLLRGSRRRVLRVLLMFREEIEKDG